MCIVKEKFKDIILSHLLHVWNTLVKVKCKLERKGPSLACSKCFLLLTLIYECFPVGCLLINVFFTVLLKNNSIC